MQFAHTAFAVQSKRNDGRMKFSFVMPHMMELKVLTQRWELSVTGADQTVMAKRVEELGYEMLAVAWVGS
jgi:hypothetical protein